MENPWNLVKTQFLHVHPADDDYVKQHNERVKRAKPDQLIQRSLPPLPFLGNPLTARVILLGKNSTFSEVDEQEAEQLPALKSENEKALTFESKYPFFYLDPDFKGTTGYLWWWDTLEELLGACEHQGVNHETVLSRLACVQWHPYRSKKPFDPNPAFPTQAYNYYLVGEAVAAGRTIVIQYGDANERNWRNKVVLPDDRIRLSSPQTRHISPTNMRPGDFDRLVQTLCADGPDSIV